MRRMLFLSALFFAALSSSGCGDDATHTDAAVTRDATSPACSAARVERDLEIGLDWTGPGVDPMTGELEPPGSEGYIVSSTYGRVLPDPAAQTRFGELMEDIIPTLLANPGLVGFRLGSAASCGSGRTLAVWRDTGAMYSFVASPAHTTAMGEVHEIAPEFSTTHYMASSLDDVSWERGAEELARLAP
jgi:hypothetical protein